MLFKCISFSLSLSLSLSLSDFHFMLCFTFFQRQISHRDERGWNILTQSETLAFLLSPILFVRSTFYSYDSILFTFFYFSLPFPLSTHILLTHFLYLSEFFLPGLLSLKCLSNKRKYQDEVDEEEAEDAEEALLKCDELLMTGEWVWGCVLCPLERSYS